MVGVEDGEAFFCAEGDEPVASLQECSLHILMGGKAVAVDVTGELLLLRVILPQSVGGADPQPRLMVAYDTADELVVELTGVGVGEKLPFRAVEEVQSFLGSDHDVAVGILTQGVDLTAAQEVQLAEGLEVEGLRVHHAQSVGRSDPQQSLAVIPLLGEVYGIRFQRVFDV